MIQPEKWVSDLASSRLLLSVHTLVNVYVDLVVFTRIAGTA